MRIVLVHWIDAGLKMGWQDPEVVANWGADSSNFLCTTVGIIYQDNDEYLILIQGSTEESVMNPVRIRKQNILLVEELNYGKEAESDSTDSDVAGHTRQDSAVGEDTEGAEHGTSPSDGCGCAACQR